MCRNALALQQTLSNITGSREVALDQAKQFYELLSMEPDVSLQQFKFDFKKIINNFVYRLY